ncbi:MAG: NAD(P)/FAD-dependent oxidoreductase [Actinomycetota bacterium]|nr:NAD(P)/FAD-dependent oxidoreductase [Actinomycetota bacterium]
MTSVGSTVGILGGGLSGLLMGMQLKRAGIDDFTIYERQSDVGGTWLRNPYPGLHCDIPSHLYSYTFEPNPDWSMVYAGHAEIQTYLRACAEKYGLLAHLRLDTSVETARYSEADGSWDLAYVRAGDVAPATVSHRLLVSATGGLTEPRIPGIAGRDRFLGVQWHSAAWRHDVDLTGLRVAVVGSAASAVQVVPQIAGQAASVTVYSRTPNWVVPRNNRLYSDAERAALSDADVLRRVRRRQYKESLLWFQAAQKVPEAMDTLRQRTFSNLRASISDPELVAALTPDYDPGCKRILVSDDFYAALALPHVRLVPKGVASLTESTVVDVDGDETEVDAVIFCTGYRLGSRADGRPAVAVTGRGDISLTEYLGERVRGYRGFATPGFPNYFTVCGINGSVGYTAVFAAAELHTETIAGMLERFIERPDLLSVEVRTEAADHYTDAVQAELATMSWSGDCPNFYRDAQGRIVSFYPGTIGRMRRELRAMDLDDFIFEVRPPVAATRP